MCDHHVQVDNQYHMSNYSVPSDNDNCYKSENILHCLGDIHQHL